MKTELLPDVRITHSSMTALTWVAVSARIFYLVSSECEEIMNAGWLAILTGAVIALPAVIIVYVFLKRYDAPLDKGIKQAFGKSGIYVVSIPAFLLFFSEAVSLIGILTDTASYSVYYRIQTKMLAAAAAASLTYVCLKGGNGIGGAARIWILIFPILFVIALIIQAGSIHAGYLSPVLGPGIGAILISGARVSIYFLMIPLSFMLETGYSVISVNHTVKTKPHSVFSLFALCAITTVLLAVFHSMLYPALPASGAGDLYNRDMSISNGRIMRSAQLPILIMWFASAFLSGAYMLYSAGRMLGNVFGKTNGAFALIPGLAVLICSLNGIRGFHEVISMCLSAAIYALWLLTPLFAIIRRRTGRMEK